MAEIKWIKITTDMFDNRKIKHLRKLPDGNNIVLIWVMLLTMAGRCNAGGMIFLTENIPYTPKMLADELGFEENTVRLALSALEQLNMIRRDGILSIPGWEEYQNIDGMARIREQTRNRVARYREKQKALPCNATVALCNGTEEEIDKERETDRDISPPTPPKNQKTGDVGTIETLSNPFSGDLRDAFDDWIAYKEEKRQPYKPRGLKSLITQIQRYAEQFGETETANAIRDSMASNYQGIVFDRIKKSDQKKTKKPNYDGSRDFFDED